MFLLCRLSRLHGCQSCGRPWQTQKPIERSVIRRRQVPTIQKIQKAVETLQMQFEDEGGRVLCDARQVLVIQKCRNSWTSHRTSTLTGSSMSQLCCNVKYELSTPSRRRWKFFRVSIVIKWLTWLW